MQHEEISQSSGSKRVINATNCSSSGARNQNEAGDAAARATGGLPSQKFKRLKEVTFRGWFEGTGLHPSALLNPSSSAQKSVLLREEGSCAGDV